MQGVRDGGKWRRAGGGDTDGAGWQEEVVQLVRGVAVVLGVGWQVNVTPSCGRWRGGG